MAAVTVRNIPEETHRALKRRAAAKGRSTEAEIRSILDEAVRPSQRLLLGSELKALGERLGGLDLSFRRDNQTVEAAEFE